MSLTYMGLTYVGDVDVLEIEEPSWDGDIYGLDTLTRVYDCPSPRVSAFIQSKLGKNDSIYPFMSFDTWSQSGQVYPRISLKYAGKRTAIDPRLSEPEYDARVTSMVVTGLRSGIQFTIEYKSPMVRTRWASQKLPNWNDKFINLPEKQIEVTAIEGANAIRLQAYGNDFNQILTDPEFALKPINRRTSFPRIRAGQWWRNTETVERVLVQEAQLVIL